MNDVKLILNKIAHCVCTYYNVSMLQLKSARKTENLVRPRWLLVLLAFKEVGDPKEIGELIDRGVESTFQVRKGAKKCIEVDEDFQNDMKIVKEFILDPSKVYVKIMSKAEKNITEKETFTRPPAIYSNRDMSKIHDYYKGIAI